MRRLANIPGITFALFFAWKVALLLFTAQPVPANDAFFYDGPVVNYLLHGKYCNPSLAEVLPISGKEVFSAYPPLHQLALLAWMKLAGTSALATMWYHVLLLGVFALALLAVLRRLNASPAAMNWAGLFLFAITFHDRPDTLAQAFGAMAVCALITGWSRRQRAWTWASAMLLVLTFGASLQIGGIYMLLLALLVLGRAALRLEKIPWAPTLCFVGTLAGLIALVKFGFPQWWAGFQEHVTITPSVTGWRLPGLGDLLKVGRASAGIFLVAALMAWFFATGKLRLQILIESPAALVTVCGLLTATALVAGCLMMLAPNTIHIANYLQPLIVGCFLTALGEIRKEHRPSRVQTLTLAAALAVVSIRAVGMTTWGVLCARDFSYRNAMQSTREEVEALTGEQPVAASSAYLYEVARISPVRWVHSDWIGNSGGGRADLELKSLIKLRPQKLILTQFDYYRRYQQILAELRTHPDLAAVRIRNLARLAPPDATPSLQKVVQHISWAPVIVEFSWRSTAGN